MSNKNRIIWIDFCKCIAIWYMVWGHTGVMHNHILAYISSFHMPIFFFLSGYTFNLEKNNKPIEYLKKKLKTLIVPYLVFGLIACAYCILFINQESTIITLKAIFTVSSIKFGQSQALWFLPCLFITEIVFYFIISKVKNVKVITVILFLFSVLGYLCGNFVNIRLPYSSDIALTAIVFYGLGYIIKNFERLNNIFENVSNKKMFILFMFIFSIICSEINGVSDIRNLVYNNYLLYYTSAILGILSYTLLFKLLCRSKVFINSIMSKFMLYFGKNTLVVLVLNEIIISFCRNRILVLNCSQFVKGLIITTITIIIFIPIIYIINKYFYFTLGKTKSEVTISEH